MKKITYAGEVLITGDDVAAAVMRLSKRLAEERAAEAIEIPILDAAGRRSTVALLVGPASQIVVEAHSGSEEELLDEEAVARIDRAAARFTAQGQAPDPPDAADWPDDL